MATTQGIGIEIANLGEFRSALRRAQDATPLELTRAIRAAGKPVVERAAQVAPMGTRPDDKHHGLLKRGYRVRAASYRGRIISLAPYGAGAEWGLHGKWSGFTKYAGFGTGGSAGRGRFAWRALVERQERVMDVLTTGLREIIEIHGWAS